MGKNLDAIHFSDLNKCDPTDVVNRTGSAYDRETRQYEIRVWGNTYIVSPDTCRIVPKNQGGSAYQDYLYLFMLHYLMTGKKIPPSGTWVSEKDIPGGEGFFRGPHLIPMQTVVDAARDDPAKFRQACEKLNGTPLDFADAAFCFEITPAVPVAVLFWQGDEDFPGDAKMLFDKTIDQHLALDIIFALAVEVCAALVKTLKSDF